MPRRRSDTARPYCERKPEIARADHEADAEGDADHAERFGAVLRLGDIGDIGLRERKIARGQSVDDARQKHQPESVREARIRNPIRVPDLADDQQRLAPHVIRHAAENGPGDQLAERVGRNQQPDDGGRSAEMFRIEREQRKDDRQAKNVNQNDEEDGEQGERFTLCGRGFLRFCALVGVFFGALPFLPIAFWLPLPC